MAVSSIRYFQQILFRILAVFSFLTLFYMLLGFVLIPGWLRYIFYITVGLYLLWFFNRLRLARWNIRNYLIDAVIVILIGITVVPVAVLSGIVSVRILVLTVKRYLTRVGDIFFLGKIRMTPSRALLFSFAGVILLGTIFLMLPASTTDHRGTPFIDAFFTATSATCVTGLVVRDTGSYFTLFGQLVILLLIQIGGLGLMTFSTFFALVIGKRIGLRTEETLRNVLGEKSRVDFSHLIIGIVKITLFFELIGALILFIRLIPDDGVVKGLYSAIFHSISAFCNAGFSIYPDNLTRYVGDITVNFVIIVLIVAGGLGFFVINDLIRKSRGGNPLTIRWQDLTVHTRLVLVTTVILIVGGALLVFFFEFDNSMLHLNTFSKFLAALFQSVTFRTAGFNTIDFSNLRQATLFIGIILMFIGASPSSTGGGVKTSTVAVLVLAIRSMFQAGDRVEVYQRSIPNQIVLQSISIFLFALTFLSTVTILLVATQTFPFLNVLFEVSSALGTVGVSTGITPYLTSVGKLLIIFLMYSGRVGPVSVAMAIREGKRVKVTFPETRVSVG